MNTFCLISDKMKIRTIWWKRSNAVFYFVQIFIWSEVSIYPKADELVPRAPIKTTNPDCIRIVLNETNCSVRFDPDFGFGRTLSEGDGFWAPFPNSYCLYLFIWAERRNKYVLLLFMFTRSAILSSKKYTGTKEISAEKGMCFSKYLSLYYIEK